MVSRFLPARRFSVLVAALLVSACVQGPDYKAPEPRIADAWVGQGGAGSVTDAPWWKDLNDPLLDHLVDEMLAGNPSLREAQARLAEARANRDAVRGGRLPQVSTSATANRVMLSENGELPFGNLPDFDRAFPILDVGFDASWEIDLWGRQARQDEAADARTAAAALSAEGTRLQLIAELTRAYVELRRAQADIAVANDTLAARQRLADLTALRARAGEADGMEANRALGEVETARVALAGAQAAGRAAALQVAVLVGQAPADLLPRLEAPGAIPEPPAAIAAGLPSDLLRRRPDILRAERELAAATADIGGARADLFPRLTLGLAMGQQARVVENLFDFDSTRLQAGGGLFWPLFNGGRARAMVRAADARAQGAAARYDAAVVGALADSETAINRFDRSLVALGAARAAVAREGAAFALAERRARQGEDDQLALARARLASLAAAQQEVRALAAAVESAVALHKALGGGWQPESQIAQAGSTHR